jgi:hypothetical protein
MEMVTTTKACPRVNGSALCRKDILPNPLSLSPRIVAL